MYVHVCTAILDDMQSVNAVSLLPLFWTTTLTLMANCNDIGFQPLVNR